MFRGKITWQQQMSQIAGLLFLAAATALGQAGAGPGTPAQSTGSSMPAEVGSGQSTSETMSQSAGESASQSNSPFLGSVPSGKATGTVLPLSLKDALARGLKFNLGLIESQQDTRATRAARLRALSRLLPNVSAQMTESLQQIDLAAEGITFPGVPTIVGPFAYTDGRAYLSQKIFDWSAIKNLQSSTQDVKAAQLSYQSSRDLVVLATGNAYLVAIADQARVDSVRSQVATAQSLYTRATDQIKAGTIAAIDELRANVELQTEQQRLIAEINQSAIDKLNLARIIGLPTGQEFALTDTIPYAPLESVSLETELQRAYAIRPDYQSAMASVHSAELARKAAVAEHYPTLNFDTNFGDIGPDFAHSHETFLVAGTVNIPIFQGGRTRADTLEADTTLKERRAELENLRGQIDYDVRTAILNLKSASDQVAVAKSNVDLAGQTLAQAQDRFAAGVTDNIEVVQAQQSVAGANEAYISSLYQHNVAKLSLARAVGVAEKAVTEYLGGK